METSTPFTYVPYIGHENIVNVIDNDTGASRKFIVSLDASFKPRFVLKNASGDNGNQGSVASYTSTDPKGRRGNMITNLDIISDGIFDPKSTEASSFYMLVRIPTGLSGLLGPQYSLANQPPAGSFDYSKFMPRTDAYGCLSFYGDTDVSSGVLPLTARFPTVPSLPQFESGSACPLLYFPVGFYPNINTILNDLNSTTTVTGFNLTVDDDQDITDNYGAMLIEIVFNGDPGVQDPGTGKIEVDFSHSDQN